MKVTITITAETDDAYVAQDAVEVLERLVPYMFDSAVVSSAVESGGK